MPIHYNCSNDEVTHQTTLKNNHGPTVVHKFSLPLYEFPPGEFPCRAGLKTSM